MIFFLIIKFFICSNYNKINFGKNIEHKNIFNEYYNNLNINPENLEIKNIKYENDNIITFDSPEKFGDLLINLFSINCEIQVNIYNEYCYIKKHENNTFSIKIPYYLINNINIHVKPVINGIYKYEEYRTCPLAINSMYYGQFILNIEGNEPTVFYFSSEIDKIQIFIKKELNKKSFVTLLFSFNEENTKFKIDYSDGNSSYIFNSTKIFLKYN